MISTAVSQQEAPGSNRLYMLSYRLDLDPPTTRIINIRDIIKKENNLQVLGLNLGYDLLGWDDRTKWVGSLNAL